MTGEDDPTRIWRRRLVPWRRLTGGPGMVTIKFQSELPTFKENLNQVTSVSLLMTSSRTLANEELFELTLVRFVDTGHLVVIRRKLTRNQVVVS